MAPSSDPDDSVAALRRRLAPSIAANAAFDGWSAAAVRSAADAAGIDPDAAAYAFDAGPMAMIAAWIAGIDTAMATALPATTLAGLPVRTRIRRLVQFRLEAVTGHEEALRRALAIMAMPHNVARALRLGWHGADVMWRLAGDVATDYNHYTKRLTLGALYTATLAIWLDDQSAGKADTMAFLDRRIEGVMRFEKAKARVLGPRPDHFSITRLLGRLRYPAA